MNLPPIVSPSEWNAAREELLTKEKEATRARDALAAERRRLPRVDVDTADGPASLPDLFRGRSQLLVQHHMFPGCPSCASMADGFDGFAIHLFHHDVAMVKVSRYPIDELTAYNERMRWKVPYVSSMDSDFNYDYGVVYHTYSAYARGT